MAITFRADKGSALTYSELDTNFGSFVTTATVSGSHLTLHYATSNNVPVSQSSVTIPLTATAEAGGVTGSIQYGSGSVLAGNSSFVYDEESGAMGIGYTLAEVQALQGSAQTANHKLIVSGSIEASGNIYAFSDLTVKSDLNVIENANNIISSLTGYTYKKDNQDNVGLIAQEVQQVLPQAVQAGTNGTLGLNYNAVVGVLVEAVKRLTKRVEELENK